VDSRNIKKLIDRLRQEPNETEWLEFKMNNCPPQLIGEYLSALSNSARCCGKPKGYLVFGIEDKTHVVKGTNFNPAKTKAKGNQDLNIWLAQGLKPPVGFEIFSITYEGKTIVLFEINATRDSPVAFFGRKYIRIGSSKTELSRHPQRERAIWDRMNLVDWSAQICEQATIDDLDSDAIARARKEYKTKFSSKAQEVDTWDNITFLNKTKLTIKGKITNTAILLLGKSESSTLLSPAVAKITWVLKDDNNKEKDYEHFGPPFLLNVERVYAKIRNLTYRHMPGGSLFPLEITQYDHWVIREALHNCIAHQDYSLHARINLVETPNAILLTNVGSFLPGGIEIVIEQDAPPEIYRNPFLADAMVNLNMIDTQGGGIKKMFQTQKERFFPLPDFDLSNPDRVLVKIQGEILDERYTRLLMKRTDLDLHTVLLLDKMQKRSVISRKDSRRLKAMKVIEGRYPNLYVSSWVADATGEKARHIRDGGLDNQYYKDLLLKLIAEHGPVNRKEIDELLWEKLPEVLSERQKKDKIHNLISYLAAKERIRNEGTNRSSKWVLGVTEEH